MQHIFRLLTIVLLALVFAPSISQAQQQKRTEIVTVQLSGRTPLGTGVIGTVVVNRTCDSVVTSDVVFNGTVNGLPARFTGKVIERWLGPGREEIEVLSTTLNGLVLNLPPIRTFNLTQTSPNLIFLDGLPIAINGNLEPPCSGRLSYIVTNVGQATAPITSLPNTANLPGWLFHPFSITLGLIGGGMLLLGMGRLLKKEIRD
jgi:hypothetical protein